MALYERWLRSPSISGSDYQYVWYPHVISRLGELHESLDHREEAVEYYGRFVERWKDADPELQPQVEAAREALVRLTGEPR